MACGVHLGFLLVCLIHAASVSCLLGTQAKLFPRQDGGAGGPQGAPQPQNQLRQVVRPVGADGPSRTGGGYRRALPQVPQNGRPLKPVVQSRPPPPPGFSWQAGMYPSTRTGQEPADSSRRASPQTPRKRPSSPLTSSALFIDSEYVQTQTSAKGRGRKVSASDAAKPQRFMSTQGRWLQGRYKSISGDSESPRDLNSGTMSRNSKFFKSTNAVPAPSGGKRAQNPSAPRKRPSGNPSVQFVPTRVLEIPDHLGGFAIRRLTKPGKRKPQQAVHLQERLSPRMHRGGRPGSSLTRWN